MDDLAVTVEYYRLTVELGKVWQEVLNGAMVEIMESTESPPLLGIKDA